MSDKLMLPTRVDWKTLFLMGGMYGLLVLNFCLYRSHPGPLLLHILLSALAIHCSFTIWHEAVHDNVSDSLWFNNLIGILGIFPYMLNPYFKSRWIHLQHHARLNEAEDPNRIYIDGPFWQIGLRYLKLISFAKKAMKNNQLTRREKAMDGLFYLTVMGLYLVAWRAGVLMDVIWLWLIPVALAKVIMDWYINYIPHVGLPPDRYRGTRILAIRWLTPLIFAHNYHAVHHLWTNYPWHRYIPVFKERIEKIKQYGVPIENRFPRYKRSRERELQPA